MNVRKLLVLIPVALGALVLPASALAGGPVVAPDPAPPQVVTGEETSLRFTVTLHGKEPLTGLRPEIKAVHESGEQITEFATPEGAPGHYVAKVRFSQPGAWGWSVRTQRDEYPFMMPAVTVKPAAAAASPASQSAAVAPQMAASWLPLAGAGGVIALAALVFAIAWRRSPTPRTRRAE